MGGEGMRHVYGRAGRGTRCFGAGMCQTGDELLGKTLKGDCSGAAAAFRAAAKRAEALSAWEHPAIEEAMRGLADELELKAGALFMLLRVATTGRAVSPPLFESMEILGKERCLQRLEQALAVLTK